MKNDTDQEIETLQQALTVLELNGNWYLAEVVKKQLQELMSTQENSGQEEKDPENPKKD